MPSSILLPRMRRLGILILVLGLGSSAYGQSLRNQSIGAMGSSSSSTSGELYIQQSIGQSSITGTFATGSAYLSQGFLRGVMTLSKEILPPFAAIAFPNAFDNQIQFRFTSDHSQPTQVQVYDSQGRKVYEQLHQPLDREIELQLPRLAAGLYLVQLTSGQRHTQIRIIKKP
uniref:T9SS type A sorting domain-containing protein n=1 Tax=Algoriphagus sp. TaxID=1872435 RepID=UPI0040472836